MSEAGSGSGRVAPGYESVEAKFREILQGQGQGAAFAATADGRVVVDLWGGVADSRRDIPWQEDTLCTVFSGTKGLVATCMLALIGEGKLDLDAPVAAYWPAFAARSKDAVRVGHVVSHQAGLPGLRIEVTAEDIPNADHMTRLLAEEALFWPSGSRTWYHPLTYGWLAGELVRSVTGQTVGQYFRERVADPFRLEMWIGLPADLEGRVAHCELSPDWAGLSPSSPPGEISIDDVRAIYENPNLFPDDLPWNSAAWRRAEIPGANGIATARAMAVHYGALASDGMWEGRSLLDRNLIELGQVQRAEGLDPCDGRQLRYGVGWALQDDQRSFGPPAKAFGHGGAGGSIHGAWPELRVGFSFVTNFMKDDDSDRRGLDLLSVLHECVSKASLTVERER